MNRDIASFFFKANASDEDIRYSDLIDIVNDNSPIWVNPYPVSTKTVFLNFVKSLVYQADFLLLDQNFSLLEIEQIQGESYSPCYKPVEQSRNINSFGELVECIQKSDSKVSLFTSGTTGQPTLATHLITNLTREVRVKADENIVWGFAYNPTHMAGIQVFFQALFNKNTLVNLFNLRPIEVSTKIKEFGISHISATPTFFRLFLTQRSEFPSVKRITLGGERSTPDLIKAIYNFFPNAKLNNIYASTEAGSLFASRDDGFIIPEEKKQYIKVINNEIFIHQHLLADSVKTQEGWYASGDIIRWVDKDETIFIIEGRKNEMLNVGGMKVNPIEVEVEILKFPGISQAIVYGIENSVVGTLLCADLVLVAGEEYNEVELKKFLRETLQPHKVPRKYNVVTFIELSRTGKTKRKSL